MKKKLVKVANQILALEQKLQAGENMNENLEKIDKLTKRDFISYNAWLKRHRPPKAILEQQRKHEFSYQPKISIVIPLYKTPLHYLDELIQSINAQTYSNWELCLSDGSGEKSLLTYVLKKYE